MFRECYFKYADISSEIYDLRLVYVSSNDSFVSGGEYVPKTESLPKTAEQLLYGFNYVEKPLEFDIEIVNTERAIPADQAMEIKNWLFGQDGWQPFVVLDESRDYYLKCLLIPQEDIVDGLGIRGFKCTLKNIGSFWFGKEQKISITKTMLNQHIQSPQHQTGVDNGDYIYWSPIEIDLPPIGVTNFKYVLPKITICLSNDLFSNEEYLFDIGVSQYSSIEELINAYENKQIEGELAIYPNRYQDDIESSLEISLGALTPKDVVSINTRYLDVECKDNPHKTIIADVGKRVFNLKFGTNICYVNNPENIESIEITYTPLYRKGAF